MIKPTFLTVNIVSLVQGYDDTKNSSISRFAILNPE